MIKTKTVNMIDVSEWDRLVMKTYGREYNFQQQDSCKERGIHSIKVPVKFPEDYENETVEERVNSNEMGVSFKSWLERDPKEKLNTQDKWDRENGLNMWWERNFYPNVDMVANDLHTKGLLPAGDYAINIDW